MGINQWTHNPADDGAGPGSAPAPRHGRAALLRLAAWFEESEPDRADALASAVYALDPARHLHGRVDGTVAATTSWWQAAPDQSTVIERPGNRRPEPVGDHRAQQARLRDAAESSAHWRRTGAEQVRSLLNEPTGQDAQLDLTGAGLEVLTELLTAALAVGDAGGRRTSAGDLEFGLRLHVLPSPGSSVTVSGEGGDLTLQDLRLFATSYEQVDPGPLLEAATAGRSPSQAPQGTGADSERTFEDESWLWGNPAETDPGAEPSEGPTVGPAAARPTEAHDDPFDGLRTGPTAAPPTGSPAAPPDPSAEPPAGFSAAPPTGRPVAGDPPGADGLPGPAPGETAADPLDGPYAHRPDREQG